MSTEQPSAILELRESIKALVFIWFAFKVAEAYLIHLGLSYLSLIVIGVEVTYLSGLCWYAWRDIKSLYLKERIEKDGY